MTKVHFVSSRVLIGLALIAILGVGLTLGAVAQNSGSRDTAPAPEKVTAVEEIELLPDPAAQAPLGYFKFISANTFVPFDDDMTYTYYNNGCMFRTGGASWTEHTVQLPQGAEIDYLRVFFFDNDATHDAEARLMAYDGYGDSTLIASATSTGTPGQSSAGSDFFSYSVNNEAEALSVSLNYEAATTSSLRICGIRIRYQYNPVRATMPLMLNQTNP